MNCRGNLVRTIMLAAGVTLAACTLLIRKSPDRQVDINPSPDAKTGTPPPVPSLSFTASPEAEFLLDGGVGILGDSFYDEYHADDQRGGEYNSVTFNLVEILADRRGFNLGPWGTWGEPRRTGYGYNWARSGATSTDLIRQGQHTGLAGQIRAGKVKYVLIGIGANDFNPYYGPDYPAIYKGEMTDRQLAKKVQDAVANVTLAVDTVQQAGAQHIILTLFTQFGLDPIIGQSFPDPARRERVARAVEEVNRQLRAMAQEKGIVLLDQNAFGIGMLPSLQENRYLNVDGELIDFLECGDEPHHSRLADRQHVGTVISGILANYYFIEQFNTHFGTNITPLSSEEILSVAGIR